MSRRRRKPAAPKAAPTARRSPEVDAGPPERARHGDTEVREVFDKDTGRHLGRGRRAVPPIERLRASLDGPSYAAAIRYQEDFLAAREGVRDTDHGIENVRVDRSRGNGAVGPADWQIDASRALAAAERALTAMERPVVEAIVGQDQPIGSYAAYHRLNPHQVTGVLKAALARLAEHYSERRKAARQRTRRSID